VGGECVQVDPDGSARVGADAGLRAIRVLERGAHVQQGRQLFGAGKTYCLQTI
jgi:hypothetical protein